MTFFGPVGQGSIHTHANELNNDLSQERSERHQVFRPLIFFAHSLGGLVLKNALFRSWLEYVSESPNKDRSMAIERSTIAVIFAGTPHRGSDKAKWASIATKMATVIQKDHSSKLADALKKGSDTLETLQDWFKKIENNFHVFTFMEEVPITKIGSVVDTGSAAIHCQHERRRMIHANHMEMVRFDDKNCNEYKKVKDAFTQIHQHDIDGRTREDIWQPPRRLERSRSSFMDAIEGPSSNGSSQPRMLEYQQRPSSFTRINTLAPEEPVEHIARRSNDRLPYLRQSELLNHRASTTTLGTVETSHSRSSGYSLRSQEDRLSVGGNDQSQYANLMEQGRRLARRRDRNFATNLMNAKSCFQQAHDLVSLNSPSGQMDLASVKYQIMNVEFETAFHRDMTPQQKLSHLQTAEQFGWDATNDVQQSVSGSPSQAGGGLLGQIQLYMAIIKGRKAEIHERLQVAAEATRRQKDDALSEIVIAMDEIRQSAPENVQESEQFARTWTERFKPPLRQQTPSQNSIPSVVAPIDTPELGTSRANTPRLPAYSELSFASRATAPPPYAENHFG
ncbi:MAG: hypothetical protein Q9201_005827 [Fulgogasparrea decipioides]